MITTQQQAKLSYDPFSILEMDHPAEELIVFALSIDGSIIKYFRHTTPAMEVSAVRQCNDNIYLLHHPSKEALDESHVGIKSDIITIHID